MNAKLLLGGGAAALAAFGLSLKPNPGGVPFLPPVATSASLCGPDGFAARQAYFLRMAGAWAAEGEAGTATLEAATVAPLAYAVTTANDEAQAWFDLGIAYVAGFNHAEAIKAFARAQDSDPSCAMCFWGEALALGAHINAPMAPDDGARAYSVLAKARGLAEGGNERERALIAALAARYTEEPVSDRAPFDAAYADAMDAVATAYPADDLIAVLAAEANMDTQPWAYWAENGRTPIGRTARTLNLLEEVLARRADYAPAIHLYIHLVEASTNPDRAAPYADKLADLAPDLGHLVHMPSHIYYRLGRWDAALERNIEAVAVDEAYIQSTDAGDLYQFGYYPHNIHFAMTSSQMGGAAEQGLAMAEKLDRKVPMAMAAAIPLAQPIKAAPLYALVQLGEPEAMMAVTVDADAPPFIRANQHYARGEGFARSGDAASSRREAAAIIALTSDPGTQALEDFDIPGPAILRIASLTVLARAAAAEGDDEAAIAFMEEAVETQDTLPYMEPPYWYYPARQTLGAMVLAAGQPERAERLFLEALARSPNNAWSLAGLEKAYRARGEKRSARYADSLFEDAWMGGRKAPPLDRL